MPLAPPDIDFLRELIRKKSGNQVSADQGYLLETRLGKLAEQTGCPATEIVNKLRQSPGLPLADQLAELMTINETSFFRDALVFDAIRSDTLPALIKARQGKNQLNIWSAAASSGQEAYSLLMMLKEHFPQLQTWKVQVWASDLSDEMLQRVKRGEYSQFEVNRGLPAKNLVKYFVRQGLNWQVRDDLRAMIHCCRLNLTSVWPALPTFDLILMRNVLIYFDVPTKEAILRKLRTQLAPDGVLFLGGGETLLGMNVPYTRQAVGKTACFVPG